MKHRPGWSWAVNNRIDDHGSVRAVSVTKSTGLTGVVNHVSGCAPRRGMPARWWSHVRYVVKVQRRIWLTPATKSSVHNSVPALAAKPLTRIGLPIAS